MKRMVFALVVVMLLPFGATAQSPLRAIWQQNKPPQFVGPFTAAVAKNYQYAFRINGGGPISVPKADVQCTTTNSPDVKACETLWTRPAPAPGDSIAMTASDGLTTSAPSDPFVTPAPPPAPEGFQIIAWLRRMMQGVNSFVFQRR